MKGGICVVRVWRAGLRLLFASEEGGGRAVRVDYLA